MGYNRKLAMLRIFIEAILVNKYFIRYWNYATVCKQVPIIK